MKLPRIKRERRIDAPDTGRGGRAYICREDEEAPPKRLFWLYFPAMLIYLETAMHLYAFRTLKGIGLPLLFAAAIGSLLTAVCTFFRPKTDKILAWAFSGLLFLMFSVQAVYFKIFKTFLTLSSMQGAQDAVTDFWKSALTGILNTLPMLLLFAVPGVLFAVFGGRALAPRKAARAFSLGSLGTSLAAYVICLIVISCSTGGEPSTKFLYFHAYVPIASIREFGVATSFRLDMTRLIFGGNIEEPDDDEPYTAPSSGQAGSSVPAEEPGQETRPHEAERRPQVMDIDWDSLIASETDKTLLKMHNYFSTRKPTSTNEYTGMFKGKNLILLTCEAFSPYAIDPVLTPTLYKMQQEGFRFTNFYTPLWEVSTSDGEWVATTGLYPKAGDWSYSKSGRQGNYMAFSLAHMLSERGYGAYAYHNNTYTYYKRNISFPNMGYKYKGVGNGLNCKKTWPESDLEMMQLSVDEYALHEPFHTYYMTVSGHLEYTYRDNMMATKHRAETEEYYGDTKSLPIKAYHACNMELDRAMEYLLKRLNELGIAENTVIAMSPDHYPYGLTDEQMDELAGKDLDELRMEKEKGVFLLYCQGQKPVTVDTLACSCDILPTLCNLFGLEYDSRLMMGSDIFDPGAPRLVIFDNYSWITEGGYYYAPQKIFTPNPGFVPEEGYTDEVFRIVKDKRRYSARILDNDYYRAVFGKDKTSAVPTVPPDKK